MFFAGKSSIMTSSATSSTATHNSYELNVSTAVYTPINDEVFQVKQDDVTGRNIAINQSGNDDVIDKNSPDYLSVVGETDDVKSRLVIPPDTSVVTSSTDSSRSSTRSNSFLLPDAKESVI